MLRSGWKVCVVITIVSGLGRCGSSLVMQMLSAGGMACIGEWPAFESQPHVATLTSNPSLLDGWAIKVLDPHRFPPAPGPNYRVIWIDRDFREQAKSTLKFLRSLGQRTDREAIPGMAKLLREDREKALDVICHLTCDILMLRYEEIKRRPRDAAVRIAGFAGGPMGVAMDVDAMVSCLQNQRTSCLHGLLEMDQLRSKRA